MSITSESATRSRGPVHLFFRSIVLRRVTDEVFGWSFSLNFRGYFRGDLKSRPTFAVRVVASCVTFGQCHRLSKEQNISTPEQPEKLEWLLR